MKQFKEVSLKLFLSCFQSKELENFGTNLFSLTTKIMFEQESDTNLLYNKFRMIQFPMIKINSRFISHFYV